MRTARGNCVCAPIAAAACSAALLAVAPAAATYSIVAVDLEHDEAGGTGTSCVGDQATVSDILGSAPGFGVVVAQAALNRDGRDRAVELLMQGQAAPAVLAEITAMSFDSRVATRQYAVVDVNGMAAGFTGGSNRTFADDMQGRTDRFVYSVQGNILTGAAVLEQAAAELDAPGCDLADTLMRALEAGARNGQGDRRCTPDGIPSDGAFIQVDRAGAAAGSFLQLRVDDTRPSSPIVALRELYDAWRREHPCPDATQAIDAGSAMDAAVAGAGGMQAVTPEAAPNAATPSVAGAAGAPTIPDSGLPNDVPSAPSAWPGVAGAMPGGGAAAGQGGTGAAARSESGGCAIAPPRRNRSVAVTTVIACLLLLGRRRKRTALAIAAAIAGSIGLVAGCADDDGGTMDGTSGSAAPGAGAAAMPTSGGRAGDVAMAGASASGGRASTAGGTGGAAGAASDAGRGGVTGSGSGGAGGQVDGGAGAGGEADGGEAGAGEPLAQCVGGAVPPESWQEHWFEHEQNLSRVYYDDCVAVYFDADMDRQEAQWLFAYVSRIWAYSLATYGAMGEERLFAIFHQDKYGGGHPSYWYDASHDDRNVVDQGSGDWSEGAYDLASHEIAHVVESTAPYPRRSSPAFGLWMDSKWAELYQYDVYVALGMTEHAQVVFDRFTGTSDDFPRAGTRWFRDWFHPLWRDHGGAQVMVKFFQLLSDHYDGGGMSWGEYVHFTSGAAGTDLQALATTAFGWPDEWQEQLEQARADYPEVTY